MSEFKQLTPASSQGRRLVSMVLNENIIAPSSGNCKFKQNSDPSYNPSSDLETDCSSSFNSSNLSETTRHALKEIDVNNTSNISSEHSLGKYIFS